MNPTTHHNPSDLDTTHFQVTVPDGCVGEWEVSRREGFCALYRGDAMWMAIIPDEIAAHQEMVARATGHVLISGLGLGMCLSAIAGKPEVEHITVIERENAVIDLVGTHYQRLLGAKLTLIHADALTWQPPEGAHWDVVWHDIWITVTAQNLPQMRALEQKYASMCDWQDCWGSENFF